MSTAFADVTSDTFCSTGTLPTSLLQQTTSSGALLVIVLVSKHCCRHSNGAMTTRQHDVKLFRFIMLETKQSVK